MNILLKNITKHHLSLSLSERVIANLYPASPTYIQARMWSLVCGYQCGYHLLASQRMYWFGHQLRINYRLLHPCKDIRELSAGQSQTALAARRRG